MLFDKDPFKIGYAMGLIVGEGSFSGYRRVPVLELKLHERDPLPLQLLGYLLGGRVYGPYCHQGRHYCLYMLRGVELEANIPVFDRYLPSSYRREQYEAWRAKYFPHLPVPDTGHVTFPDLYE
jgi:hypothetical protein